MDNGLFSNPTPFTPPTTVEDKLSWLRLIRSHRVGTATFYRLLAEHGSAARALEALPQIATAAGVRNYTPCPEDAARAEYRAGRASGAVLICRGESAYPAALADITDAPPVIWVRGDLTLLSRPMIALVGARNASSLGQRMARRLAAGLAGAGYVVVSGLARGIDTAAHEAALPGATIAVLAGGLDVIYPAENAALAARIADTGILLSEQPPGLSPQARHFPLRNRIISGLARGVVVVEAAVRSGSLITARDALDQGREVFAVPGHPFDGRAGGCNMLLRDGATLVRGVEDILDVLGSAPVSGEHVPCARPAPSCGRDTAASAPPITTSTNDGARSAATLNVGRLHAAILSRLGPNPLAEDQLIRDLALPSAAILPEILALELDGKIARHAGGLLCRTV